MVEVTVELLASIAVTVLLMLVFLGVVVAWDIALALRDVAEKIDSLEDDVDEDLGKVDGTLTRIHDRMSEIVAAQQQRSEAARNAQAPGSPADHRDAHSDFAAAAGAAGQYSRPATDQSPFAATARSTGTGARPRVGLGAPGGRSTGVPVGRTGNQQLSPSTAIGGFQVTDRDRERKEADSRGIDAAAIDDDGGESSAESVDEEATDPADASDSSIDDGEAGEDGDSPGEPEEADDAETPEDVEAAEEAEALEDTEVPAHDERPDDAVEAGSAPEEAVAAGGEAETLAAEEGTPPADEDVVGDADAADGEATVADDATSAAEEPEPDPDPEEADDERLEPDRSAARAVQNFGRDAQTNRGFGPAPTRESKTTDEDDSAGQTEATDDDAETGDVEADGGAVSNEGRFATDAEEPWYRTAIEPASLADSGQDQSAVEDAKPAEDDTRVPDADGVGPVEAAAAAALEARPSEAVADEPAEDETVDDEPANEETGADESADDELLDVSESLPAEPEEPESGQTELEEPESEEDGLEEPESAPDTPGDDSPEADGPGIADLVNQELHSLTQEVGGTSLSPDVSEMELQAAVDALDETDYTFPLSGRAFDVSASVDTETVTIRFTPGDDLDLSGARERLLRYQLRNYLDGEATPHGEVLVDEGDLVLEIPGATAESVDTWADAMIQIVDRTLYLTASDE
ncbi:hypothetical protein [Haloarchaeobius amylolyticus]|uniref:hypothetical protein n=1 Tax=Haloarchaeobius amylolyticus TaxID=1198296 RepID=UPI0022702977|nr:hypothetical protein [Haloarchaeobius amylolyticus]